MQSTTPIAEETDASLLAMMAKRKDDRALAFAAWEEFYKRHVSFVYVFCRRALKQVRDYELVAADTMDRALRYAGSFNPAGLSDRQALEMRTRRWLKQIAKNVILATIEKEKQERVEYRDPVEFSEFRVLPTANSEARENNGLRTAIAALSHNQREVVLTWLQYGDPTNPTAPLSDEVIKEVCERLNITPSNFRQIKKRALAKLASLLGRSHFEAEPDESKTTAT